MPSCVVSNHASGKKKCGAKVRPRAWFLGCNSDFLAGIVAISASRHGQVGFRRAYPELPGARAWARGVVVRGRVLLHGRHPHGLAAAVHLSHAHAGCGCLMRLRSPGIVLGLSVTEKGNRTGVDKKAVVYSFFMLWSLSMLTPTHTRDRCCPSFHVLLKKFHSILLCNLGFMAGFCCPALCITTCPLRRS